MKYASLFLLTLFISLGIQVQAKSTKGMYVNDILGKYKVVGRETSETRAIVEAKKDKKGKYYFQIVELNKNAMGYQEKCVKCPGSFKNKPLDGLIIAWNLQGINNKPNQYHKAFGLDPWTGKMFRGELKLSNSKNILYITATPLGTSLVSRKLRWLRVK